MKTIEIKNTATCAAKDERCFVQTRQNGDAEIVKSSSFYNSEHGPLDQVVGVIPKSQRAEIAAFLLNA